MVSIAIKTMYLLMSSRLKLVILLRKGGDGLHEKLCKKNNKDIDAGTSFPSWHQFNQPS